MNNRLEQIFRIISFYDDNRWESFHNYSMINFFRNDLSADIKILTHWLCYIMDRQTPFLRIWDIGGFVISELIYEVKKQKSLDLLNPDYENSFLIRENNDKFCFISKSKAESNSVLSKYEGIFEDGRVKFKSRFFPSDYIAILSTLVFLEEYGFSFSKFIKDVYCRHKDKDDFIKRILFSLSLLTYGEIGQTDSRNLVDFEENKRKAKERKNRIKEILFQPNRFNAKYNHFLEDRVFKQKRAWCSLRDFIKSPEIKGYFQEALSEEGLTSSDFQKLFSYDALAQLELPGDVWNTNSKFRKCILKNTDYENCDWSLNKILRVFYDNNPHIVGYPEQFDITFDFVQRMCVQNNCKLCPIYKIDNEDNRFNKICIKNENMYCPVVLVGCNYHNNCVGKDRCKLLPFPVIGFRDFS